MCLIFFINSNISGNDETCDITKLNVEKCFETLWTQDCMNTLYEYGLSNELLVFLFDKFKESSIQIQRVVNDAVLGLVDSVLNVARFSELHNTAITQF